MKNIRTTLLALGLIVASPFAVFGLPDPVAAATAATSKTPPVLIDNGWLLFRVDSSDAKDITEAFYKLRDEGAKGALKPAGLGNVMDNPQGFKPGLGVLAFLWNDKIVYLVEQPTGGYEFNEHYTPKGMVYLLFWEPLKD